MFFHTGSSSECYLHLHQAASNKQNEDKKLVFIVRCLLPDIRIVGFSKTFLESELYASWSFFLKMHHLS